MTTADRRGVSPFRGWDVRRLVDTWARRAPDRPFLTWAPFEGGSVTWTWSEFARDAARLAGGLAARGVRRGDRVAISLPNHPAFLLTWTAAASMGATAVLIDPGASRAEHAFMLEHAEASLIVTTAERAREVSVPAVVHEGSGPDSIERLLAHDPLASRGVVDGSAPASIQFTSGTTSRPKAVVWTQANCLWAARLGAEHLRLSESDVTLIHLPLFHTNALSYTFLAALWAGASVVLQPRFSASRFWPAAVAHRATRTSIVSFCLRAMRDQPVPDDHAFGLWGHSAALDPSPATGGTRAVGWFGMTETVSHPLVSDVAHPSPSGSIGRPALGYDVRVSRDDGGPVAPGEVGELQILGRPGVSLFAEYLHQPDATAAAFADDGWFRTGDRVRCDDDGTWWFVERDKDVLKVAGENVGAAEIERVLLSHEAVREAAVVGRPDELRGEVPVAFVLLARGVATDALHALCADELAAFKRPREIRVVDEMPRSTLDKIAKAELRRLLREETTCA